MGSSYKDYLNFPMFHSIMLLSAPMICLSIRSLHKFYHSILTDSKSVPELLDIFTKRNELNQLCEAPA